MTTTTLNYSDSLTQSASSHTTPILLMHGLFGSLSNLGLIGRALTQAGYRVIAIDMRNHGLSPHQAHMSYPAMAADIIALMDDLNIKQAHMLGHSMGGKVGMQVAMNHPERVAKLIIADIAPVTYSIHRHNGILDGLQALSDTALTSRNQADELLSSYEPEPGIRAFLLKNLYRKDDGSYSLRLNLASINANYCDALNLAPTGSPFTGDCLFLKGANSAYIQDKHKALIHQLFPQAKIEVIENAGHWLHAEQSALFNQHCLDFLNA